MHSIFLFFSFLLVGALGIPQDVRERLSPCGVDGFQCDTGDCIKSVQVCDGAKDCPDGSDETKAVCSRLSISCPSYSFQCAYGACVDKPLVCDGKPDCADGSDELLPQCRSNSTASPHPVTLPSSCRRYQFRCDSGQCIDDTLVCDGRADCRDASDESITQCVNFPCPVFSFQCTYGACIDKDLKCNGEFDCNDGSDEDEDICSPNAGSNNRPAQSPNRPTQPANSPSGTRCVLPELPRKGKYDVANCKNCGLRPGDLVSTPSTLIYSCPVNSTFEGTETAGPIRVHCSTDAETHSSSWTFPNHPLECVWTCRPLAHASILTTCRFQGRDISCEERVPHGTIAVIECQTNYKSPEVASSIASCQDGTWDNSFRCTPECGIIHHDTVIPSVSHGEDTSSLDHPWHAGIYVKNETEGQMELICGGSIISPYVVLSAAHCMFANGRKRNESEFRVAVGKTHRKWDINDAGQQVFLVQNYVLQNRYTGQGGDYTQDIAILDLYKIITISRIVMPVCLETVKPYTVLSSTTVGYVVGWGTTETGRLAEVLQLARLLYLDGVECKRRAPAFQNYITYDKFCGLHTNGSKIEMGDSGGGWTYEKPSNGLHYLRGIVSLKPKDSGQDFFTAFTDVQSHMEFIQTTLRIIERNHERERT